MDKVVRTGISFEPKLLKLFDKFIKEKGYKLAIASSAAMDYINIVIEKFSLQDYFDQEQRNKR